MNRLISSFKRYFALAVLLLILLLLLWLKLFVAPQVPKETAVTAPSPYPSPPETVLTESVKIPQSPNVLSETKADFNYTGERLDAPSKLSVYAPVEPTKINLELATVYAGKFGFTNQPVVSETTASEAPFYLWQEGNKVFSIGGSFPVISFNDYSFFENVNSPSTISENLLLAKAKEEIEKLSISNIDVNSPAYFYYKTSNDEITNETELTPIANKNEASYVGIGLSYKLNGYLFISDAPLNLPVFMIFDANGQLLEFTAYLFNPSPTTATTPVIPFEQALKQLNKNGVIFSALSNNDKNQKGIPVYNIKSVDLDNVVIKYYLPVNFTSSIVPYYVFSGTAIDEDSEEIVALTILLPVN